jgi:Ser/Thr protein kinase RdoA (MazF antagonist)
LIPHAVLSKYNFDQSVQVTPFGSGLINHTWKITKDHQSFILQRINQSVFKHPPDIAYNIDLVADHLQKNHPEYFFVSPMPSINGNHMVHVEGEGYFRLFPFVPGSHSVDVVQSAGEAYEAALQFGRFTKLLKTVDVSKLKITIPQFHDLSLRYRQFSDALQKGNSSRIKESAAFIQTIKDHAHIVTTYEQIKQDAGWLLRVTHHDTKISNVLFNEEGKGICVIDLDTIMPGYFISDVGDMMRTYLSPVSEEETDMNKVEVRESFYKAIVDGYASEMKHELTNAERNYFFYAGEFMIYMQALRFLTDYLNDDIYYGARYPTHNLLRAQNQLVLLEKLIEKKSILGSYLGSNES